ncbi:uncharacterized protein LOC135440554 [Drosophila montana]|uniref:uncharacterized protein LOC135440554 n=1 Tax=Drosophila montana TaxID=40370 RepID=UPI00313C31B4
MSLCTKANTKAFKAHGRLDGCPGAPGLCAGVASPCCSQMLERLSCTERFKLLAETGAGYIHLMHWVLVWLAYPDLRRVCGQRLRRLCRKLHLPRPFRFPSQVLRVSYKDEQSSVCKAQQSLCLSRMSAAHALLTANHARLAQSDAALRTARGSGGRVHSHAMRHGWTNSRFGRSPRCLIICELLEHEQTQLQDQTPAEFVILDPSCLRVRYLVLFTENKSIKVNRYFPNLASCTESSGSGSASSGSGAGTGSGRGFFRIARWLMKRALQLVQFKPSVYY